MRVLLDTNVLLSAILFGGVSRTLLDGTIAGEVRLVTSPILLDELEEVLAEKFGFSGPAAHEVRVEIEVLADVVETPELPAVARDPDDDAVLAAAVVAAADSIVTGDRDLLDLESHRGIPIVTPAVFARGGRPGPETP